MRKFAALFTLLVFVLTAIGCNKNIPTNNEINDALKLQMENSNFKFYSFNKDKSCLSDLAKVLDANYNRI